MAMDLDADILEKILKILDSMQETFKDFRQGCVDREKERASEERKLAAIKAEKERLIRKLSDGVQRVAGRRRPYPGTVPEKRGRINCKREGRKENLPEKTTTKIRRGKEGKIVQILKVPQVSETWMKGRKIPGVKRGDKRTKNQQTTTWPAMKTRVKKRLGFKEAEDGWQRGRKKTSAVEWLSWQGCRRKKRRRPTIRGRWQENRRPEMRRLMGEDGGLRWEKKKTLKVLKFADGVNLFWTVKKAWEKGKFREEEGGKVPSHVKCLLVGPRVGKSSKFNGNLIHGLILIAAVEAHNFAIKANQGEGGVWAAYWAEFKTFNGSPF